jgi:hypothetical protein
MSSTNTSFYTQSVRDEEKSFVTLTPGRSGVSPHQTPPYSLCEELEGSGLVVGTRTAELVARMYNIFFFVIDAPE